MGTSLMKKLNACLAASLVLACAATPLAAQSRRRTPTVVADPTIFPPDKRSKPQRDGEDGALVEAILEKYVKALGGRAALARIDTRIMRGTIRLSVTDAPGKFESYTKAPNKSLVMIDAPGLGQFIKASDGRDGWMQTPFGGSHLMAGAADEAFIDGDGDERFAVRYRDYFESTSYRGEGRVGERAVHIVAATQRTRGPQVLYFDKQTGQLLRMDLRRKGAKGEVSASVYFDSFAKVDGVTLPVNVREVFPEFTLTYMMYEVKHNVHIDDSMFEKPAARKDE